VPVKDYGIVSQKHYLVHQGYLNTEFYGRRKPGLKPHVFLFSDMMLLCVEAPTENEKVKYIVEVLPRLNFSFRFERKKQKNTQQQ
jgi:hypothetical protein